MHQSSNQLPRSYQRASTSSSHPSRAVKKAPNQQNPHDGTRQLFLSQQGHRHRATQRKTTRAETGHEGRTLRGSSHTDAAKRRSHRSGNQRERRLGNRAPAERLQKCNVARVTERRRCHNKPPSEFDTVQAPTMEQECGETSWIKRLICSLRQEKSTLSAPTDRKGPKTPPWYTGDVWTQLVTEVVVVCVFGVSVV